MELNNKPAMLADAFLFLFDACAATHFYYSYNKNNKEKKSLEEELNSDKAFGMTREEFYDFYEETNRFSDSEELDPAIAQFTDDEKQEQKKMEKSHKNDDK